MNKLEIIESIKNDKPYLQEHFGVEEIALFGSYVRGEETEESDIDIMVKISMKTLKNYFSLLDYLESKFKKKIDLVTKHKNLSDRFIRIISKDIVYV
ncbi:MAG: toxin-antitoxin system toxin subunit [Bacteroidetes bacterium CG02_land_8_20_14_3_00_31_25]|nr:nucleotidyltransferase family protein [Bacteroidota bacterium]PIV59607.1 MAG: toxin-antitoxin system toxin subunit [Bacteroidetes bacterium CG02_land_8_20_14_3_00_31_25]PIX35766.1 MAG: toxin-antitoxin system toxin subunit [Bacteroidetes bacterium CG_4_8_14_3_um_filter_31_14]PIY02632.1 MAG: toxin-antitoxin system toxin subunit [Bacteroidetes bacterium CG_4_10_14_3_um_filter_31_20]